jgi:hypothetical protein
MRKVPALIGIPRRKSCRAQLSFPAQSTFHSRLTYRFCERWGITYRSVNLVNVRLHGKQLIGRASRLTTLAYLHARGIRLAIVSDILGDCEYAFSNLGLRQHARDLWARECCKPDHRMSCALEFGAESFYLKFGGSEAHVKTEIIRAYRSFTRT